MMDLPLPEGSRPSRAKRSNHNKDVTTEILPNGAKLHTLVDCIRRPDGRRCDCCPNKDSQEDPVIKILKSKLAPGELLPEDGPWTKFLYQSAEGLWLTWWGYKPLDDGKTHGATCGSCMHVFNARHKGRRITLTAWKRELGSSTELLTAHQNLVTVCHEQVAAKGGNFRAHLDWVACDKQALILCKTIQVKKTRPGFEWLPTWCPALVKLASVLVTGAGSSSSTSRESSSKDAGVAIHATGCDGR